VLGDTRRRGDDREIGILGGRQWVERVGEQQGGRVDLRAVEAIAQR
jgi:hypothetical protein